MLVSAHDSYQRLWQVLNYLLAQIEAGSSISYTHDPNLELGIVSISLSQVLLTSTSFNVMCYVYHAKCVLHQRSRVDFPLTYPSTSVAFLLESTNTY